MWQVFPFSWCSMLVLLHTVLLRCCAMVMWYVCSCYDIRAVSAMMMVIQSHIVLDGVLLLRGY